MSQVTIERRALTSLELRDDRLGQPPVIAGYAAIYDVETVIGGLFREVVRPGAFDRAIRDGADVVAWYAHGDGGQLPLGASYAGTLRLSLDGYGLLYEITPPDTPGARAVIEAIRRGEVRGSSFAFSVPPGGDRWVEAPGELPLRELLDVDLWDVSPVVWPAYDQTTVSVRSAADVLAGARLESAPAPTNHDRTDELELVHRRLRLLIV